VKVTLLSLLAQGALRIEEQSTKWLFGTRKTVFVRPTGSQPRSLPPHAASLLACVREAQDHNGSMPVVVARARKFYGPNLAGFKSTFILPALIGRGLLAERRVLLFFRRYDVTPAGVAEQSHIENDMRRIRTIPDLLRSDPAEAAAIALAAGGTVLLVAELRPHYRELSAAMRRQAGPDGGDAGGDGVDGISSFWSPDDPGAHLPHPDATGGDHHAFGGFDLASFDAFSALDASIDSFDAGFDASSSGDGGGDGGDGGGGH
jgi:hypothetical protein